MVLELDVRVPGKLTQETDDDFASKPHRLGSYEMQPGVFLSSMTTLCGILFAPNQLD